MNTYKKIRAILTPKERKKMFFLFFLMFIGMWLETLGVGILFPVMVIMGQKDLTIRYPIVAPVVAYLGNPTQNQLIVGVLLVLVGIFFIKNLFLAFIAWRQVRYSSGIQTNLAQRLFSTYLRLPYTFHLQRNSAQLAHNIGEVNVFTSVIGSSMTMLTESLAFLGIVVLLLMAEPLGVMILIIVLGVAVWSFHSVTRSRITRWGEARQHHDALRGKHMYQGLGGVKDVKLLGREKTFLAQFQLHSSQGARVAGSQAILQQLPRLWLELLAVTGLALLVMSMLGQGFSTERIVPTLGLFAAAAFRLLPSVNRMIAGIQLLRYQLPSVNLMYEEARQTIVEPDLILESDNTTNYFFKNEICLSNISYIYPGASAQSIDDVSIIISKGETVGFIGPSGSGKSTMVDIILGLLPPADGKVLVDGDDIQKNLRVWQNQIGYVPQAIYLTDDTLRHNVAFGLPNEEIDDVAVQRAIKDAQLEEFVAGLPNGLETIVGERGIRLSGGQRQRIGIARALYHDPAVLVLDEATSALDTSTEQGVMRAVTALHGSKTILIVAHRLSTVEHCDRLYRLEQGKVVAKGTPKEMLVP
ncbi:MAG: ABC transporter ATP-binding protein/permease [Spirochaetia bacterium]|nr:ABC transporter ATP-binding protein/permease [Spirochaetia bacterium]